MCCFVPFLHGIAASIGTSNFSPCVFEGFLVILVIRVNKVNSSQSSSIVDFGLLDLPTLAFLSFERLFQFWSTLQNHTFSGLVVA